MKIKKYWSCHHQISACSKKSNVQFYLVGLGLFWQFKPVGTVLFGLVLRRLSKDPRGHQYRNGRNPSFGGLRLCTLSSVLMSKQKHVKHMTDKAQLVVKSWLVKGYYVSNEKIPCYFGYIGDYPIQLCGYCTKPSNKDPY